MARLTTTILLATALVTTAACSKKRPEVLPPAPGEAPTTGQTGQTGPVDGVVTPGSAEDFKRSVTSDTVNFGLDQYDIDGTARGILDSQVVWLQRYPNVRVTIEGHADERGTREYNYSLGARRAQTVQDYLASRGISASRMRTVSYGKERPVAVCNDISCWSQNRRSVSVLDGGAGS